MLVSKGKIKTTGFENYGYVDVKCAKMTWNIE